MNNAGAQYDVLVIGGGNAGLCAAVTARELGARVLVLECAPRALRGGNSRHTRNLRCAHAAPTQLLTDAYPEEELLADLERANEGETDEALARLVAARSAECVPWMAARGARFQAALRGTGLRVIEQRAHAALGEHLRDAAAHGAGAGDAGDEVAAGGIEHGKGLF